MYEYDVQYKKRYHPGTFLDKEKTIQKLKLLGPIDHRFHGHGETKLGTRHYSVNRIQVCSNEWPCPLPRGDNYKIVKIF